MTEPSRTLADPGPADRRANVEAILPLSPNQRALLLYREREKDDPGFIQVRCTLQGTLDPTRFERAWEEVLAWHQALRTSIHSRPGADPMAVVWRRVTVPVDGPTPAAGDEALDAIVEADRRAGLDLSDPPVMRVTVVQTAPGLHEVIWTCHHLFVDGWSAAIVLEDLLAIYHAPDEGDLHPPPPDGLRAHAAWLARREPAREEAYWRSRLAGFEGAPRLALGVVAAGSAGHGESTVGLDADTAEQVRRAATRHNVTVNALVQSAWALVLGGLLDRTDVVFGTTVAGRAVDVEGMERLVGYFSNAVPVRVRLVEDERVADLLQTVRNDQFSMQPFEYASLAEVHSWSPVPGHRPLFDTFLVVENFPHTPAGESGDLTLAGFRSGLTTAFPLTVAFALGEPWFLHCRFDAARISPDAADRVLEELIGTLREISGDDDRSVREVLESARQRLAGLLVADPGVSADETGPGYRPPSSDVEKRLAAIWQELLGLSQVGVDDDYFALGGTSIGAVGLFGRIEDEFGVALPLRSLLGHPTIGRLASLIAGPGAAVEPGPTLECLVPIRSAGSRVPITCVHGGDGEILKFRALAEQLGPDQPLYGVEAVGVDGSRPPLDSVGAMAEQYVTELRSVQPTGPYRLVGYCFGGSVCLEMARRLEAAGEEVDFLAVIDGGLPLEAARTESTLARAIVVLRTRGVRGALQAAVRRLRDRGRVAWDGSVSGTARRKRTYLRVAAGCRDAFSRYVPAPSHAPITLIRSDRDHAGLDRDWHMGWDAYTPQFTVVSIDADHDDLFDDEVVGEMAAAIRAHLPG